MPSSILAARALVAVAILAPVAALATACSSGGTPGPTTTVTHTATASPTTPAGSPTPTATGTAACGTAGLRVSVGASQGAAGTTYTSIDFTNISGAPCVIGGYPGVSLVSAGSNAGSQIGSDAKRDPTIPVRSITLAAGQTAHAVLGVAVAANYPASTCHPVTAHWLKVFPPNQYTAAYVSFTTQTCASTSVPTMHIQAIAPGA